jgi:hypothetical protein
MNKSLAEMFKEAGRRPVPYEGLSALTQTRLSRHRNMPESSLKDSKKSESLESFPEKTKLVREDAG